MQKLLWNMQPPSPLKRNKSKKLVNLLLTSSQTLPGEDKRMSENSARPRTGSKAVAIDNRAEMAKIRLLLFVSILLSAGLAFVLQVVFGH